MRHITLFLLLLLTIPSLYAQKETYADENYILYKLEARLRKGDKSALLKLAPYLDSKKIIIEYLGYHRLEVEEYTIAHRVIAENTLFTKEEIDFTKEVSTAQFTEFLNRNIDKIIFSEQASSLLITPLDQRNIRFELRAISEVRKQKLENEIQSLLNLEWVKENGIDALIVKRNPSCLLTIASVLYKNRDRYNEYYFDDVNFVSLLQYLTQTDVGVENENGEISWHIHEDFDPASKLNMLIYFSKYYYQYHWDDQRRIFVNPYQEIKPISKEEILFELLGNENDSLSIDAFIQLSTCAPDQVQKLAKEYDEANIHANYILPTFPYRFLIQLVALTEYCRGSQIDYVGSPELQHKMLLLRSKLTFAERRKLEDDLINTLTLDEITAFEYWALVYESSWGLTYSSGRILDVFYSKNWNKLLANKKYLDCYLKKSALFESIGIIGICNNYLVKFTDSSAATKDLLKNYSTNDKQIQAEIEKILNTVPAKTEKVTRSWEGNKNYKVQNLKQELDNLMTNVQDSAQTERKLIEVLSQISYSQIPVAMSAIEDYPFRSLWAKYDFMRSDWGLYFVINDFEKKEVRENFLKVYSTRTEYELYAYYLDLGGIDYKTNDSLDYDKIYELLKYDVVTAFVGGGGGDQDNEAYAIIKLLELTFGTTLGYPDKFCSSNNIYSCSADDRAEAWTAYLRNKKLLKQKHDEPISFHHK